MFDVATIRLLYTRCQRELHSLCPFCCGRVLPSDRSLAERLSTCPGVWVGRATSAPARCRDAPTDRRDLGDLPTPFAGLAEELGYGAITGAPAPIGSVLVTCGSTPCAVAHPCRAGRRS